MNLRKLKLGLIATFYLSFSAPGTLSSQVKVATDPNLASPAHPSAILEILSTDKGMLPPRMTTTQRNAIPAPANGLMIYNTTENCLNEYMGGFWKTYCDLRFSTACNCVEYLKDNGLTTQVWIPLASNDWTILGNTGTNPTTNFLGTIDNQALSLRVNNIIKLRLETNGTLSFLNSGRSVFAGENAGTNDDLSNNYNAFVGYNSGNANTTGSSNVAMGVHSFRANTSGFRSVAVGANSLRFNTTGHSNTALGSTCAYNNTTGNSNTALGNSALNKNTTGNYNVAIGLQAANDLDPGSSNVAIGFRAFGYIEGGSYNIGIGHGGLQGLSTVGPSSFDDVVGIGRFTFRYKQLGNNSVGVGAYACHGELTGFNNTGIGYYAIQNNRNGSYITGIGSNSGNISPNTAQYTNSTALGANTTINSSNKVRIGSATVTVVEGQVAYSFISDARFKTNVKEDIPGLDFVMGLRPISYNFNTKKFDEFLLQTQPDSIKSRMLNGEYAKSSSIKYSGFIAQEVEALSSKLHYDFSGVNSPKNAYDNYSVSYSTFVVPLVKAVQEQQVVIEELKEKEANTQAKFDALQRQEADTQAKVDALQQRLERLEKLIQEQ